MQPIIDAGHARPRRTDRPGTAPATTGGAALRLAAAEADLVVDRFDREVLLVPDPVALYMRAQILDGWTEHAHGGGHSRPFTAPTDMYALAAALAAFFAGSDVPAGLPVAHHSEARHDRQRVADGGTCYAQVVGVSDWDAAGRDFRGHIDLHVPGSPYRARHAGLAAYVWRA